jgi:presenilin-like A22 family membrane protease
LNILNQQVGKHLNLVVRILKMKHSWHIVLVLLGLFLASNIVGLVVVDLYEVDQDLPFNIERPEMSEQTSFVSLFVFILIVTGIALLLIKYQLFKVWKAWFFLSVFFTLLITFGAFFMQSIAFILAIVLAVWKVFKPNVIIHNFTEVFIYGALAVVFAPLLNVWSTIMLLILISVYDYISVRKTKHMVKLAESQKKSKVFAGLQVPYENNVAILGGGDIGFPLLLASVVMTSNGLGPLNWQSYIVPLTAMLALAYLFLTGENKKYYPAMPYITVGCLMGLGILTLIL